VTALGIVVFVVALLTSVMLHEAGHFYTARRFGMKATQFFVGFGPTLWSRHKGETEYGVKAIPAGGFVKIVGMTPLEEVEPGDEERAFYKQPAGRKTIVLAAGSTVHFLICIVLVFLTVATYGSLKETNPRLASISACVGATLLPDCGYPGADIAPAKTAGLRAGDVVQSVDGTRVTSADALTSIIKKHPGEPVTVVVRRDGADKAIRITPSAVFRGGKVIGAIGVSVQPKYHTVHYGVVGTFKETGATIGTIVTGTYDTFTKKLGTITQVYGPNRDPGGFIGVYGASKVSGEIAAAPVPLSDRVASIVLLIAGLNLFVGVFNLLPLLPLDGGHIAVVAFESVRDRIKRARGYVGEVKRVDYNRLMPLTFAVVVLFASFTVFLLGADIVNPITLN
jgi:membrane-associated protease RseP (regulator of RpoE activity)